LLQALNGDALLLINQKCLSLATFLKKRAATSVKHWRPFSHFPMTQKREKASQIRSWVGVAEVEDEERDQSMWRVTSIPMEIIGRYSCSEISIPLNQTFVHSVANCDAQKVKRTGTGTERGDQKDKLDSISSTYYTHLTSPLSWPFWHMCVCSLGGVLCVAEYVYNTAFQGL